ncbi:MAG: insulinase family protein [Corallococcus sp.]|nr:insulinase family protein [Bacillota bacterium]MCM1533544.1 insulinase family protein [Corallococcus sp.]
MDFYKKYSSGLRLVAKKLENLYTVSFGVFVDVGCVKEDADTNGYSHFIEHLLFKGTNKRTSLQISEEIDDIGANINAYTSKDNTCFYTKSAAEDLEKCIDVLSDMYFNATVPEDELEREKGVVLEEIKMCEDTPDDVSQDLVSKALFHNQTLGQTILGNPDNIKYSDRHNILNFKKKHYIPTNTVISVCGKFEFDALDKLIEQYFEANFSGTYAQTVVEPDVEYTSKFFHSFKQIEQSHIQLAWGGYGFASTDRYANNMLASILGGGMSSRLCQEIRERNGLAYSVYAYPSYYLKGGTFEIYVGLSPDNFAKTLIIIKRELNKLLDDGITQRELARARTQAVNSLYMNVENSMTLMRLYGRSMLKFNETFNADSEIEQYKSVGLEDINAVARSVFAKSCASAYVGPEIGDFKPLSQFKLNKRK